MTIRKDTSVQEKEKDHHPHQPNSTEDERYFVGCALNAGGRLDGRPTRGRYRRIERKHCIIIPRQNILRKRNGYHQNRRTNHIGEISSERVSATSKPIHGHFSKSMMDQKRCKRDNRKEGSSAEGAWGNPERPTSSQRTVKKDEKKTSFERASISNIEADARP